MPVQSLYENRMIVLRILRWNPEAAWTQLDSYHPKDLPRRLARYTDLDRLAIKRLVRQIKDRQCLSIKSHDAADRFDAHSLRQFLESIGAEVNVEHGTGSPVKNSERPCS